MAQPAEIKIIAFPGAPNLPVFAAIEHGHFAEEGLEVLGVEVRRAFGLRQDEIEDEGCFDEIVKR